MSLKELQTIFKTDKVELVFSNNVKIASYYKIMRFRSSAKPELYVVTIVPLKNSAIKGLKFLEKVDLAQLRPSGPFKVEIYLGNQINRNSFMESIHDSFMPPPPPNGFVPFLHSLPPRSLGIKFNDIKNGKVNIIDNDGKTVATLLIKAGSPPKPFGPYNPIENIIGFIILFAGSTLSLLVGFYINRNFIKPLLILSEASKQVQNGDLCFELATNTRQPQILNTFHNFNQMIKGLKEKEELRKSFISSLTHDLKTPLIAQERSLSFISKKFEKLNLKDDYELAKSLEKNNKHLLRMVNLILESYRFDSENLNLIISNINIFNLADSCYEKLKPLASEKNIQLLNNISKEFPLVIGDMTSFKRIFLNLISNAIENITENGKIQISAETCGDFIKIFIEDNGSGIEQEDLTCIFNRYYTGKSLERNIGSGLGLYICKKLVEMHNGEITVESQIGNFTRFIITLPLNINEDKDKQ